MKEERRLSRKQQKQKDLSTLTEKQREIKEYREARKKLQFKQAVQSYEEELKCLGKYNHSQGKMFKRYLTRKGS